LLRLACNLAALLCLQMDADLMFLPERDHRPGDA
jgi:hypothetical protein